MAASAPGSAVDAIAIPLAAGERPPTWGLNLNVFPQGQADLAAPFAAWKALAAPLLAATGAYLYDTPYLHVTASSPAPFTHAPLASWSEAERTRYERAWGAALAAVCTRAACPQWPAAPFPLIFRELQLHASCAIFLVEDPTGAVGAIRECVAAAAALVQGTEGELLGRSGWKSPKIVHSTIMRIVAPTEPGVMQAAWAEAAARWPQEGVTITCKEMVYLREVVAYQHMQDPDTPEFVIARFPYAA